MADSRLADVRDGIQMEEPGTADIIVLITGKAGVGKSAVGNILLRRCVFESGTSQANITVQSQLESVAMEKYNIKVIDTPDLLGGSFSDVEEREHLSDLNYILSPGINVHLMVMRVGRKAETNEAAINKVQSLFGEEILKFTIVVFTGKDDLDYDNISLSEYLDGTDKSVKILVNDSAGGCVLINAKDVNSESNKLIMQSIDQMLRRNNGTPFHPQREPISGRTILTSVLYYVTFLLVTWKGSNTNWMYGVVINSTMWIVVLWTTRRCFFLHFQKKESLRYILMLGTVWFNSITYGMPTIIRIMANILFPLFGTVTLLKTCKTTVMKKLLPWFSLTVSLISFGLFDIFSSHSFPWSGIKCTLIALGWMTWLNRVQMNKYMTFRF